MTFKKTEKQVSAMKILADPDSADVMLYGGSRSGKTFIGVRALVIRAVKAPGSHHCIIRRIFRDCKQKIGMGTLPEVMTKCFPNLPYTIDRSNWVCILRNGSQIWLAGCDSSGNRHERILGAEYSTLMFEEASELDYETIGIAKSRLAEKNNLKKRSIYTMNPPRKGHWTFKQFVELKNPLDGTKLDNTRYVSIQMNPDGNLENIDPDYLETLKQLPKRQRERFLHGLFGDDEDGKLWLWKWISDNRRCDIPMDENGDPLPLYIAIGVDPGGALTNSDATGIVVVGRDADRHYWVLESKEIRDLPGVWAREVCDLYKMYGAAVVVAERNYGGALVKATIQSVDAAVRVEEVYASKGKVVRAEPISALYEQGLVHHVGEHPTLEDELMMLDMNEPPRPSPNQADAAVWALSHLSGGGIISPRVSTETADRQENTDETPKQIADMSIVEILDAEELWDDL